MSTTQSTPSSAEIIATSGTEQFLTFKIGESEYGVDIMSVREVKGWVATTRLPNRPDYVRGVLNLRGIIVPIFDLRARFGQGLTEATEKHVMIIIALGDRIAGALVDAVSDILTVTSEAVKPPPSGDLEISDQFVRGLIAVEERMVILLDMEKLLRADMDEALTNETLN